MGAGGVGRGRWWPGLRGRTCLLKGCCANKRAMYSRCGEGNMRRVGLHLGAATMLSVKMVR